MNNPLYLKKKLGMRRRIIPFTNKPYILNFRLTMAHKNRLYALTRETGEPIDEVLWMIFKLGLVREKDESGRTDKVYYDLDMDYNDENF